MNVKKEIEIDFKDSEVTSFIKDLKQKLVNMETENYGPFGDFELLRKSRAFNSLEDWEKNLYCLYIYSGSYKKMEKYLNVKAGTICTTLKEIRDKARSNY